MPKRNLIWIVAIIAAAVVVAWVTRSPRPADYSRSGRAPLAPPARTHRLIRENYYLPVDDKTLHRGAVRGMVRQLDEFSSYIPPERVDEFSHRVRGLQRGLGLRLEIAAGAVTVVGPLPGSPAHRASLTYGDRIVAIDGEKPDGLTLREVRRLLDGEIDTPVVLTVIRSGAEQQETIELLRDEFPLETVLGCYRDHIGRRVYAIDPQTGLIYVRIREFVQNTAEEFQRAFRQLSGIRGLILDLRDNPGGRLAAAVEAADMFISKGVIVTKLTRQSAPRIYQAHNEGTFPPIPMVVLINGRTASAAEIVAGALRFRDRAVLVGSRTRGKGCVQTMFPLQGNLGQINLTTSEFCFEQDRRITRRPGSDVWGVDPHEPVVISPAQREALEWLWARAEVLPPEAEPPQAHSARQRRMLAKWVKADPQLARAVRLIRSPKRLDAILARAAEQREKEQKLRQMRKARSRNEE
ncbi:MAG: S41 family peptidase [Planctomycetota bacterium]|nr:S41 family peptidase [Planctomycetota bacterium]